MFEDTEGIDSGADFTSNLLSQSVRVSPVETWLLEFISCLSCGCACVRVWSCVGSCGSCGRGHCSRLVRADRLQVAAGGGALAEASCPEGAAK